MVAGGHPADYSKEIGVGNQRRGPRRLQQETARSRIALADMVFGIFSAPTSWRVCRAFAKRTHPDRRSHVLRRRQRPRLANRPWSSTLTEAKS